MRVLSIFLVCFLVIPYLRSLPYVYTQKLIVVVTKNVSIP